MPSPRTVINPADRFEWATDQSGTVPTILHKTADAEAEEEKPKPSNLFCLGIVCAVLSSTLIVAFLSAFVFNKEVGVASPSPPVYHPAHPSGAPSAPKRPQVLEDYSEDTIFPPETETTDTSSRKDFVTTRRLSTTLRPQTMQSLMFSCGHLLYRTFYMDRERELLFVGGMDKLFKLSLANINTSICGDRRTELSVPPRSDHVDSCVMRGGEKDTECRNHIKILQPIRDGTTLYVCGSSAKRPTDFEVHGENFTVVPDADRTLLGGSDAVGRCSLDVYDKNTAVWVDDAPDNGTSALFSGCVTNYDKTDPVVARTGIYDPGTRRLVYSFLRTERYDTRVLREASFVGSYAMGEYVYIFFREIAEDYRACGRVTHSRVARICKNDRGGGRGYQTKWTSYVKARLNCSIPGAVPFYFNNMQNVYKIPGDDEIVYAVFTTPAYLGIFGSAVCAFKMTDVLNTFNGSFAEQKSTHALWGPVSELRVPKPRPGLCSSDSRNLPDSVKNFLSLHPLLMSVVPHHRKDQLVFYRRGVTFVSVAVTKVAVLEVEYTVYYVGTSNGHIFKLAERRDPSGKLVSELLDTFRANPKEPIRQLGISEKHKALYAFSDDAVRQFGLDACARRYVHCITCVRDPFCGWDAIERHCKPYVDVNANATNIAVPAGTDGHTSDPSSRSCASP